MTECEPITYHERQRSLYCGKHAINNLLQKKVATCKNLYTVAKKLAEETGIPITELAIKKKGKYDISVLLNFLKPNYEVYQIPETKFGSMSRRQSRRLLGYILGDGEHWVCLRKTHTTDCYFYIDSLDDEVYHVSNVKEFLEHFDFLFAIKVLEKKS